ncbi:uncharacterized protein (DUF924 family) [Paraburkholderia silvatlantica]|nr:uncharacterized protein (DUF924 family) [Paraburkholderia silvatlantica]PXW34301.1 uncharacterized protein (DUF924 family) [Paraburkholderia silvatlantica]TDQ85196.1 uncharacterized protein (DUF924 family) [Paraburkholderia silvatlantica]
MQRSVNSHLAGADRNASVSPGAIVEFWRAAQSDWFSQAPEFDVRFRERFLRTHCAAVAGNFDHWTGTPDGALALLILLDQFPRNAFRGTARMYASDAQARAVAGLAVDAGLDMRVEPELRLFFYLPFAHSENLDDQHRSVTLHRGIGPPWLGHALGHRAIIERFGRFPHRNILLGRPTTVMEQAFLDQGGFAG